MQFIGILFVWLSALALTLCCILLVIGFLGADNSLEYVVKYRSNSASNLALLYKISGLWAGRAGSLLFWAWLISVFNAIVALRAWLLSRRKAAQLNNDSPAAPSVLKANSTALDSAALLVAQLVLLVFLAIIMLAQGNQPFAPLPAEFLDASGNLTGAATLWGLNPLLEHWAMAIHPPTLFAGYAGMTIPFAYAIATLVVNDPSRTWVERSSRYTLVSWLFLGIGIGLGAIWAYVELSFGGYWGWDPVENASLLPWGAAVALVHSMTNYRQRGTMKRWTVMLACVTFAFVIIGTFITRSGIVESVHAFEFNLIATILFGCLIFVPLILGALGLIVRREAFVDETDAISEAESFMSKDVAYFLNNVIMLLCMGALIVMTLWPLITGLTPLGRITLGAADFARYARPLSILYCIILAVCPLLAWKKTSAADFLRNARIPGIAAVVVFVALCAYFATTLLPSYMATMAQGGDAARDLLAGGPFILYAALTLIGFLTASLLAFNALFLLIRALRKRNLRVQTLGGFVSHMAIGVLLVGLIGSSMYSYAKEGSLISDFQGSSDYHGMAVNQASDSFTIKNYTLRYVSTEADESDNGDDILYTLTLAVEKNGVSVGQVSPQVLVVQSTGQQSSHPAVLSSPLEDLFVVFQGLDGMGNYALDVRINHLIWFVWIGFALLMLGTTVAAVGRRK
jgi:cytochrome c-type biogenesis protein CcmF